MKKTNLINGRRDEIKYNRDPEVSQRNVMLSLSKQNNGAKTLNRLRQAQADNR